MSFSTALPMPQARTRRAVSRRLLIALVLSGPATAWACTSVYPDQPVNLVVNAWDDTTPDVLIADWRTAGNVSFLLGCPAGDVPIDVTPSLPGLEFERFVTVGGERFPAFGLVGNPASPLLIFRHSAASANGGQAEKEQPFDIRVPLHISGLNLLAGSRWSYVSIAAVSRGGDMRPVPAMEVGSVSHRAPAYPHLVKTETYRFTANLRTKTCQLDDTPVALQDIQDIDLPRVGSTAAEKSFGVAMRCNGAFPADLVLTDPNDAGNTSSILSPSANATAGAVQVQLLRAGAPVVLGQHWAIPATQNGKQDIELRARYYRQSGTFHGGVVEGQAMLTVTYR